MVGARSLAMALNRLIDARIDAGNPRTAGRELPSGQLSVVQVVLFCAASLALFGLAVSQLAPKTHWLWPIPVAGFVIYPYLKRWTWLCHFWLGAVDGFALSARGSPSRITSRAVVAPRAAVAFWSQASILLRPVRRDVDRAQGLHSIVTRRCRGAFIGARISHPATVCVSSASVSACGRRSTDRRGVVAALFVYEHSLVRPTTCAVSTPPSSRRTVRSALRSRCS